MHGTDLVNALQAIVDALAADEQLQVTEAQVWQLLLLLEEIHSIILRIDSQQ